MHEQPPTCPDCLQWMEDPHDCPAIEPPSTHWRQMRPNVFGVAISDALQLTQLGLSRAILKIPYRERVGSFGYKFGREWREGKQRWIEIICG